jgi:hypothetical protein
VATCWGDNSHGQLGNAYGELRDQYRSWRPFPADVLAPLATPLPAHAPGALSGLWWNAAESGWGIHLAQRRNHVFATWYAYDSAGNPKWYAAPDCAMPEGDTGATGTCSGAIYEVSGTAFLGVAFDPDAIRATEAGSIQIAFQDANHATLSYTASGQSRAVPIARMLFAAGAVSGVDYSDHWWNPGEPGWGIAVTQQAGIMFLAWYVYDAEGEPVWYVASDCAVRASGCSGSLYRTTGPRSGGPFDPALVRVLPAGAVHLDFTDANNGVLTYAVDGVSGSKSISRLLF